MFLIASMYLWLAATSIDEDTADVDWEAEVAELQKKKVSLHFTHRRRVTLTFLFILGYTNDHQACFTASVQCARLIPPNFSPSNRTRAKVKNTRAIARGRGCIGYGFRG